MIDEGLFDRCAGQAMLAVISVGHECRGSYMEDGSTGVKHTLQNVFGNVSGDTHFSILTKSKQLHEHTIQTIAHNLVVGPIRRILCINSIKERSKK